MKVLVEFLSLPNVVKIVGGRSIRFDFSGHTIDELVSELVATHGQKLRDFLLDDSGRLDMTLRIVLNKKWISRDQMSTKIDDGDSVTIMMLVGGG